MYISYVIISITGHINIITYMSQKGHWGSELLGDLAKDPMNTSVWILENRKHSLYFL